MDKILNSYFLVETNIYKVRSAEVGAISTLVYLSDLLNKQSFVLNVTSKDYLLVLEGKTITYNNYNISLLPNTKLLNTLYN